MNQKRFQSKWSGNNVGQVYTRETQNGDLEMDQIGREGPGAMSGVSNSFKDMDKNGDQSRLAIDAMGKKF